MRQINNKILLFKIFLFSIFTYLILLPLFSLQVTAPKGRYISANYTLISIYNQGFINKNITKLQEIAMINNNTANNMLKKYNIRNNKKIIEYNQKENQNRFVVFNTGNNFIGKNQLLNVSFKTNNIFQSNYPVSKQINNSKENSSPVVDKKIKSEILNIIPGNVKDLYNKKPSVIAANYVKPVRDYKYVSYINGKPEGISLLNF